MTDGVSVRIINADSDEVFEGGDEHIGLILPAKPSKGDNIIVKKDKETIYYLCVGCTMMVAPKEQAKGKWFPVIGVFARKLHTEKEGDE